MTADSSFCRAYGHHWTPHFVTADRHYFCQSMRCAECDSYRYDEISRTTGKTKRRSYRYSEGYLIPGNRRSRTDFRLEMLFSDKFLLAAPVPDEMRTKANGEPIDRVS